MSAAVFHGHERITIERVAIPEVAAGEVLVRVFASGINPSDTKMRSGWRGAVTNWCWWRATARGWTPWLRNWAARK